MCHILYVLVSDAAQMEGLGTDDATVATISGLYTSGTADWGPRGLAVKCGGDGGAGRRPISPVVAHLNLPYRVVLSVS